MKLIIQIPCFNEAQSLPLTLRELPRQVAGFDRVEWLVIDDGSHDDTVAVAAALGVDYVVRLKQHLGLARAFTCGLENCLRHGADVIVNTDADNQYRASDIDKLVSPVLQRKADMVIGARPIDDIPHFSASKKKLQKLGTAVVRSASQTQVADATSGFRAIAREAAMQLHVFNEYTYTLDTIIQAGRQKLTILSVPVGVNPDLRPSRLITSIPRYIWRSSLTILRLWLMYRAGALLSCLMAFFLLAAGMPLAYSWCGGCSSERAMLVSLVVLGTGVLCALPLLAELLAVNRRLLQDVQQRLKRLEYGRGNEDTKQT